MVNEKKHSSCEIKKVEKSPLKAACSADAILIKMIGLGNMDVALLLNDFIESCNNDLFSKVIVDLSDCLGMDSTFMGTLLNLSYILEKKPATLIVCNVSSANKALFKMLGVDQIVNICGEVCTSDFNLISIPVIVADPKERLKVIREAHRSLISADDSNRERFGTFMSALDAEMDD